MMRYLKRLADRDYGLDRGMIPLGSCTMKLNAAAEMEAMTWPAFSQMHPFAPVEDQAGSLRLIRDLEIWLAELTGYDTVSLQPNAVPRASTPVWQPSVAITSLAVILSVMCAWFQRPRMALMPPLPLRQASGLSSSSQMTTALSTVMIWLPRLLLTRGASPRS
ncbi:glycine dehydrogenase [Cutibacterium acnes JCM 18918]|nr:glycine dehydrogenase [Cutibacterium acnes JCM 18918]